MENKQEMSTSSNQNLQLTGIDELQVDINTLLLLYFNAIGVIQRDCLEENISETMENLEKDLKMCKGRIDNYLNNEVSVLSLNERWKSIIEDGENFVSDATYFLDKILDS